MKFNRLMRHRVRTVLLVSTAYDAFVLQEEGNLTEQIFLEYKALSLSSAPHVTHVESEKEALELLQKERFDLVLRIARLADTDLGQFGRQVKQLRPGIPVVVLGFDHAEMTRLRHLVSREEIDSIYLWSGEARILLAIIKEAEDRANLDEDLATADLRVILVVEDSIRYYSAFLSVLYPELMKQSQALFSEGINLLDRLLRMRTRPKVLHVINYEEALAAVGKYRHNLLALISDVGFPREGRLDPRAGLDLAAQLRREMPDLPIVLQSAEDKYATEASQLGLFVNKSSPRLLQEVRAFLINYLGFGPFIFRMPDGQEVARARDIREFAECIGRIPEESLYYHASRNHFSNWLLARSEFDLAARLRPQKVSDFSSLEELRRYLIDELNKLRRAEVAGAVSEFSRFQFDPESLFQRIGQGPLGGKGRGLAFINYLLYENPQLQPAGLRVSIPQTFALTTEAYEQFIEDNHLRDILGKNLPDQTIRQHFLQGRLSQEVEASLWAVLENVNGPLAVRSSSLLEDDMLHPLAGVYDTIMLPNCADTIGQRMHELAQAVKLVYSSCTLKKAREYLEKTGHRVEEEKMAVVIQRLVGKRFERRFYPEFSGVAQSYNYYPQPPARPGDGVVLLALGLGYTVVGGGECLRFSPRYPQRVAHLSDPATFMKFSQRHFYALEMDARWLPADRLVEKLNRLPLEVALEDGVLPRVASVFNVADNSISDSTHSGGPWLVTFNNILKYNSIPLAQALANILDITARAMGTAVEIEFAGDMGNGEQPALYLLQLRPVLSRPRHQLLPSLDTESKRVVGRSTSSLGHGQYQLNDIVFVNRSNYQPAANRQIAREIEKVNGELTAAGRRYLLVGPGRWGSSDHWLGIPVQWNQISAAAVIIEAALPGYQVEPSQGSHFFHNLTSMQLGYLTVQANQDKDNFIDWNWLQSLPLHCRSEMVSHAVLDKPILVSIDGESSHSVIAVSC